MMGAAVPLEVRSPPWEFSTSLRVRWSPNMPVSAPHVQRPARRCFDYPSLRRLQQAIESPPTPRHFPPVPSSDVTARYIALVEQIGDESGKAHGWRRRAAEKLGIGESTLSKILKGTRVVGMDLAERAIERLELNRAYFWTETPASSAAGSPVDPELEALLAKFEGRKADIADIYALAKATAESPSVVQAQKILKTRKPQSEQKIGALFLEASKFISLLETTTKH